MGVALWRREEVDAVSTASVVGARFRLTVFGKPRAPWRASYREAEEDAIALGLASWDANQREHFLAVPVDVRRKLPPRS